MVTICTGTVVTICTGKVVTICTGTVVTIGTGTVVYLYRYSGHYMYHQFNIQLFYLLPTLYLCVLCGSESKQRLIPYTALTDWFL